MSSRAAGRRARAARKALIPALLLCPLALPACAIDNRGVVLGRITHADGAVVADLYSIGLHLKTRPGDTGLVVGYSRSSYVFARTGDSAAAEQGWHAIVVPVPDKRPTALHLESGGLSLHRNHNAAGATLGYRAYTLLARAAADSSEFFALRYTPQEPAKTRLRTCEDQRQCETLQ